MAKKGKAVIKGKSILALDVLGEVRRAQRILRRVEKYLTREHQPGGGGGEPRRRSMAADQMAADPAPLG